MKATTISQRRILKNYYLAVFTGLLIAWVLFCLDSSRVQAATQWAPREWQEGTPPKLRSTPYDLNGDFIDDRIPLDRPNERVDILILFNQPIGLREIPIITKMYVPRERYSLIAKYLPIVGLRDVRVGDIPSIVAHKKVAFVQLDEILEAHLDISNRNIKNRDSVDFAGTNVQAVFPTINGAGGNTAILDTGVDDITHETFVGQFKFGYNAFTGAEGNPPDDNGHGTHVAGIALGTGGPTCVADPFSPACLYRGVAPGAGLVDVKVLSASGAGSASTIIKGIEKVIEKKDAWNIKVMNMSLGTKVVYGDPKFPASNGTDAVSVAVNTAVAQGIIAVVSAGNNGPVNYGLGTPSAATLAITVANSNDMGTVDRGPSSVPPGDDTMAPSSSRGPRKDPPATINDLKPEITAPGTAIMSAKNGTVSTYVPKTGTSMSAPHVAGIAALIVQANPTINPGDLKELLIQTAEPQDAPTYPAMHASWNKAWGYGLVDAYAAMSSTALTDLSFPSYPPPQPWQSPDIWANPDPLSPVPDHVDPSTGVPTYLHALVTNNGPSVSGPFKVRFGVFRFFTSGPAKFFDLGVKVISSLMVGETKVVHFGPYTPTLLANGQEHACMKVTIDYGKDTNYTNNTAQRNIRIITTHSPGVVPIRIETEEPADIQLQVTTEDPRWMPRLTAWQFRFNAGDKGREETLFIEPPQDAELDETTNVHVTAIARPLSGGEPYVIGGVTAQVVAGEHYGRPVVVMLNPTNGTEIIETGRVSTFRWLSFSDTPLVRQEVALSLDSGRTFPYVLANLPGSATSLDWLVPLTLATVEARIRVTAYAASGLSGFGDSNADFTILESVPPTVRVTSPRGGEVLHAGSNFNITWQSSDNAGLAAHHILLSTDGGATWSITATGIPGTAQSYQWLVPSGLSTASARLRVVACDLSGNEGEDVSGLFTIGP